MKKHLKRTGIVLLVLVLAFLVYALPYYHAQDLPAYDAEDVTVSYSTGLITYDGPGEDRALIFYPGAKVDEEAYGWMMEQLAENGIDCYLVHMPLHFAIFGKNKAQDIMEAHPEYEHWVMAGHSLGGAMAASFAGSHADEVDGLVLLASYSTVPLENMKVLSVYGSLDGVLNRESYAKYRENLPNDFTELAIEGGNHAGFAYYGDQKGDNPAEISKKEQQEQTVQAVLQCFETMKE
ncbi:MAG: alpha/beta hydrolase [Bulleidia sp.]|nr:alpha/beta hydrolase [Bulleidia sp.]